MLLCFTPGYQDKSRVKSNALRGGLLRAHAKNRAKSDTVVGIGLSGWDFYSQFWGRVKKGCGQIAHTAGGVQSTELVPIEIGPQFFAFDAGYGLDLYDAVCRTLPDFYPFAQS